MIGQKEKQKPQTGMGLEVLLVLFWLAMAAFGLALVTAVTGCQIQGETHEPRVQDKIWSDWDLRWPSLPVRVYSLSGSFQQPLKAVVDIVNGSVCSSMFKLTHDPYHADVVAEVGNPADLGCPQSEGCALLHKGTVHILVHPRTSGMHQLRIIMHELGHALSLEHDNLGTSVMSGHYDDDGHGHGALPLEYSWPAVQALQSRYYCN